MAHDVGRSRDSSTAVIGGNCPVGPRLLGIKELEELPKGLYGSQRASALAVIDRRHNSNALIVADLSNDPTYAESLFDTFGALRVIGLQISRFGDGKTAELRLVRNSAIRVYTIGRTTLLQLFETEMKSDQVRFVDGAMSRRAYEQLANLETETRDGRIVYTCPPGKHDDLGISCAMLAWAACHRDLPEWARIIERSHIVHKPKHKFNWAACT